MSVRSPQKITKSTKKISKVNDTVTEPQQESLLRTVQSAAGFSEERGDLVTVEPLPFSSEMRDKRLAEEAAEQARRDRILYMEIAAVVLLGALLLGGFLMYRRKKQQEREAYEAAVRAEEAERRREEEEQRARDIEAERIAEDSMTPEEKKQRDEKRAVLKLIDEKPADVAMLIKTWLAEDD